MKIMRFQARTNFPSPDEPFEEWYDLHEDNTGLDHEAVFRALESMSKTRTTLPVVRLTYSTGNWTELRLVGF